MRNVPWDQALDVVLQAKGLGMVRQGNLIRVAPLAELEKERELAIARRKQELELAPLETRLIPVCYAQADELQARAREMLSPRGSIAVDERTNVLIVRDVAGNLNQIEELVRSLDTQTPQVLVEARIVEATSRYLRDVGIQWGGDATFSRGHRQPDRPRVPVGRRPRRRRDRRARRRPPASRRSSATVANPNFAVNLPAAVGTGQRRRARPHARLDRQQRQPRRAPLGGRVERHAAHHLEPAHPHARQPATRASARAR